MLKYGYFLLKLVFKPISIPWSMYRSLLDECKEMRRKIDNMSLTDEFPEFEDTEEYRDYKNLLDLLQNKKNKKSSR